MNREEFQAQLQEAQDKAYDAFCATLAKLLKEVEFPIITNGIARVFMACLEITADRAKEGRFKDQICLLVLRDRLDEFWESNKDINIDKKNVDMFLKIKELQRD